MSRRPPSSAGGYGAKKASFQQRSWKPTKPFDKKPFNKKPYGDFKKPFAGSARSVEDAQIDPAVRIYGSYLTGTLCEEVVWYEHLSALESQLLRPTNSSESGKFFSFSLSSAQALLKAEAEARDASAKKRAKDSTQTEEEEENEKFAKRVLKSGTLTDRIAALTVRIGEHPVQSLDELEQLVSMCEKQGRREAGLAREALLDVFNHSLLPNDRRLRTFEACVIQISPNAKPSKELAELLTLYAFEDAIKARYLRLVLRVINSTRDNLDHFKRSSMNCLFEMLRDKPEQERLILSSLCEKLGDPEPKSRAHANRLLEKITNEHHPAMRPAVVSEIEAIVLRPSTSPQAAYAGVLFLNQTVFGAGDEALALKLVDVYVRLFDKESLEGKMLSAVLTGLNRALPFASIQGADSSSLHRALDRLEKVAKSSPFANAVQALSLLYTLVFAAANADPSRKRAFLVCLYARLADDEFWTSTKRAVFLNVVHRVVKSKASSIECSKSILKRLLATTLASDSGAETSAAALILMSSALTARKELCGVIGVQPTAEESRDATIQDGMASVRGALSASVHLKSGKPNPPSGANADASSAENARQLDTYDFEAADPTTARANKATMSWELSAYRKHVHPALRVFASDLAAFRGINYEGDPIRDFSLSAFLDKFVYRNPKTTNQAAEDAKAVKKNVFGLFGREQRVGKAALAAAPANSEKFYNQPSIRPDEKFLKTHLDELKQSGRKHLAQGMLKPGDEGYVDPDDMEEAFAAKLAEDMITQAAGGVGVDAMDEDIDFGSYASSDEDDDEDGEDDDDDDSDVDDGEGMMDDGEFDDDGDDMDFSDDEDDDDEEGDDSEEEDLPKSRRPKHVKSDSVFADAEDFEHLIGAAQAREAREESKEVDGYMRKRAQSASGRNFHKRRKH